MELEHREFLKENYNNYETALSGYVRNLDLPVLKMYEHIYRLYLNNTFILTIWCGDCRMQMILRLYKYYESLPIENKIIEVIEPEQVIIKKTKKKRNG
jgi:hypothetical protein